MAALTVVKRDEVVVVVKVGRRKTTVVPGFPPGFAMHRKIHDWIGQCQCDYLYRAKDKVLHSP